VLYRGYTVHHYFLYKRSHNSYWYTTVSSSLSHFAWNFQCHIWQ